MDISKWKELKALELACGVPLPRQYNRNHSWKFTSHCQTSPLKTAVYTGEQHHKAYL